MHYTLLSALLLLLPVNLVHSEYVEYKGHKVVKVTPQTQEQLTFLTAIDGEFDVWMSATKLNREVHVRIPPQKQPSLLTTFKKLGLDFDVMIEDVGEIIRNEQHVRERANNRIKNDAKPQIFQLDEYHTLAEIQEYINQIATDYDFVELITLPEQSYEGRDIQLLKFSIGADKPAMWLDGGIHSREWVSPSTMVYFINMIATGYASEDPTVVAMLEAFDWYILPVFNVDGYEYTWTNDRLWRKTRSANEGSTCIGTDPNRNWDIEWGTVGVSTNPCFDTYCGPEAFSEIEVRTVVDYLETIPNLVGYFAYHSYSQFYMIPVGYEPDKVEDFDELLEVCLLAEAAIEATHNMDYICEQLYELVGASSGSSADYTYIQMGIKFSYGVELRDQGEYGFLLPEDQIVPTAEESWEGIKVFAQEISNAVSRKN